MVVEAYLTQCFVFSGQSQLLLKPKSTAEVSGILKYCNERRLSVCPQGGNTGLVFGSVPIYDEIILSTSAMDQIIDLDEFTGTIGVGSIGNDISYVGTKAAATFNDMSFISR